MLRAELSGWSALSAVFNENDEHIPNPYNSMNKNPQVFENTNDTNRNSRKRASSVGMSLKPYHQARERDYIRRFFVDE